MLKRYQPNRFIFLLVLFVNGIVLPQQIEWHTLPGSPVAARNDDIFFVNETTGWVVNSNGYIFRTTDGGTTWTQQFHGSSYFRSVGFANENIGWAGTLDPQNILYSTKNGGAEWTPVTNLSFPHPQRICGIFVVNENVMYGSGAYDGPPIVIKTTDGGLTWQSFDLSSYAGTLIDCYFKDADNGFVAGGTAPTSSFPETIKAVILKTTDGGNTWQKKYEGGDEGEWCWKISFLNSNFGYASIENFNKANILKTTDGGETWTNLSVADNHDIQGIGFISDKIGWVGGYGVTSSTTDGGLTWTGGGFGKWVNRYRIINDSTVYASGKTIYKYSRTTSTGIKTTTEKIDDTYKMLLPNYPNPFNNSTVINYRLPEAGSVRLIIYDGLGKTIRVLLNEFESSGEHTVSWDGKDDSGDVVASGVYLYRLDAGNRSESRSMLMLK